MKSLGIDLSTKGTGLVLIEETGTKTPALHHEQELSFPGHTGLELYRRISLVIMELIAATQPDRVVLEGYSLHLGHRTSVIPLVELGGIVRLMLMLDGQQWLDPRASELKKFTCNSGAAKKNQMMMMVHHRWGHLSKSDNCADGFALACIGLAHLGKLPGLTIEQRSVVGQLKLRQN